MINKKLTINEKILNKFCAAINVVKSYADVLLSISFLHLLKSYFARGEDINIYSVNAANVFARIFKIIQTRCMKDEC